MAQRVAKYLEAWVKTQPALYDRIAQGKRRFSELADPLFDTLDRFSQAHGGAVRFIVAGAGDGLVDDPLRELIVRDDWRGVLVEPAPETFIRLCRNYAPERFPHLRLVNAAVVAREDEAPTLYAPAGGALKALPAETRRALARLASFDRERLVQGLSGHEVGLSVIEAIKPPITTVERLSKSFFDNGVFELLMLDTGGQETQLLTSLDLDRVHPAAILFRADMAEDARARITARLVRGGYALRPVGDFAIASLV